MNAESSMRSAVPCCTARITPRLLDLRRQTAVRLEFRMTAVEECHCGCDGQVRAELRPFCVGDIDRTTVLVVRH